MAGRRAKPIALHLASGNPSHLTKAEIEHRQKSEIKLGSTRLTCPAFVKSNKVAYAKWKEMIKLYAGFDFVASGDVGLLARYCVTFSEYQDLIERRSKVAMWPDNEADEADVIESLLDNEGWSQKRIKNLIERYEYILSVGGILAIDKAINAKMDALVKMEDRLFLNPLAKIKNVPKKPDEEEEDPLAAKGFGDI